LECPDKFKDVQDLPESGVIKVEEISVRSKLGRETAVLPDNQSNQS